ncbi:MAG: DUF4386 family protein [Crocinitomix sp.]|nr:DUF4386 family protein [Crocinitomix sp.]
MKPTIRLARQTGFLYLLLIPFGVFGILYIPMQFIDPEDIMATMNNIAADKLTFRLSIISALVAQLIQILTVFWLYQLLKSVNKNIAILMVISILVAVPIAMLNELNNFAVLESLGNADQVSLFLKLHEYGIVIAQVFWGIWLFPMGYLVYKSGFIPKIIGVLLMIACFGYLIDSFMVFLNIDLGFVLSEFTFIGELAIILWLLIKGVKRD